MKITRTRVFLVLLLSLAIGGAFFLGQQRTPELAPEQKQTPAAVQAMTSSSAPEPSTASPSSIPAILHPIEASQSADPELPALDKVDAYVMQALVSLLGQQNVQTFLLGEGLVRHVVATVDNMPQGHAPWTVWPVNRTSGRFTTLGVESNGSQAEFLSAKNAARYTPLVKFIESVDTMRAVALYVQLYPLFQKAYEELGYPGRYFNDRLVVVIDHLLTTPKVTEPIQVKLVDVKGSVKSLQPWTRYEFADPALEGLSAGQKILLRVGSGNQQSLKAKLHDFREQIVNSARRR